MRRQFVYFVKPIGMDGPVKIGCSALPRDRRHQLAAWSPFDLEMVVCIPGSRALEERFHAYFIDDHHRQEWFLPSARMKETIAALNAGTFDFDMLPPSVGCIRHAVRARGKETPLQSEYREAYAKLHLTRRRPGLMTHGWPPCPSLSRKKSEEKQRADLTYIREILSRAEAA